MSSQAQIEANRKNALLGGVKTEEGKAISRLNAQKDGIFAKTFKSVEECELFERVSLLLYEEYQPTTFTHAYLVERLACLIIRQLRLQRAEQEYLNNKYITEYIAKNDDRLSIDYSGFYPSTPAPVIRIPESHLPSLVADDIQKMEQIYLRYDSHLTKQIMRIVNELRKFRFQNNNENIRPSFKKEVLDELAE